MEIKGKVALVTGSGTRIGKVIAKVLADKGAKVALHYHHNEPQSGSVFQADLSKHQESEKLVAAVEKKFGTIDILVNNASIFEKTSFGKISEEDWNSHLDINLKAPFFLAQAAAKGMLHKKSGPSSGKIINIADYMGIKPATHYLPYSVSKAGLIGLTKALAKELAPHIQVNAIGLGPTLPPESYSDAMKEKIADKTLLKKWGSPAEVANAVCFLIEGSDFATGSTLFMDGGRLLD